MYIIYLDIFMLSIFICSNWIHATQYEVGSSKKLINLKIKNGIIFPCSDLFVIYKIPFSSLRFRWILCAIYTEIVIASHIIIDAHNVEKCVCNQPTIANHTTCLKFFIRLSVHLFCKLFRTPTYTWRTQDQFQLPLL